MSLPNYSMAAIQNKRKREPQDMGSMRAPPAMNQAGNEFDQTYLHTDDDVMDGSMDFSAIVDHSAGQLDPGDVQHDPNHVQVQSGDTGAGNASDTAAAAMAHYHVMTVPTSTEQAFMTQPTEGGERQGGTTAEQGDANQPRAGSFGEFDAGGNQDSPNGDASPSAAAGTNSSNKPSVGSDEWHKIRKDNHKEGAPVPSPQYTLVH